MDTSMEDIKSSIRELILAQQADKVHFAENERLLKEMFQETARRFQETDRKFQETDRKFQETDLKFQETDQKFQETDRKFQETERILKDKFQETDRKFQETERILTEKFQETDKRINKAFQLFESQWGKLIESLVQGDLLRLLNERNIPVQSITQRREGSFQGQNYEFDLIAHNGAEIVIVEVKTTLRASHVRKFLEQLKQVHTWLPEYKDYKVYGAVAFLRSEENSREYALNEGLFVIRATGNSASIENPEDFKPRAF